MDIDRVRMWHLAVGEWIDAWRLIPRLLVAGYSYLVYQVIDWYMKLQPYVMEGCGVDISQCIVVAPSTQHAVLVTAVVSMGAAIFGLYTNTGRKWSDGVVVWNKPQDVTDSSSV